MTAPPFESVPQLRTRTLQGIVKTFHKMQKDVMLRGGLRPEKLPPFVRHYLRGFFDITDGDVRAALSHGDPWFFIAWRGRLAQIDLAMIEAGATVGERWSLAKGQHLCALLELVCRKRLAALGGPQVSGDSPDDDQVSDSVRQDG
jgi:hypothetical protein